MKRSFLFVLPFFASLLLFSWAPPASLSIGSSMPMPDYSMTTAEGNQVVLNKQMGKKGLLVMFSCNTCPYVIKNQNRTRQILTYAAMKEYGVIIVNSNEGYRGGEDSPEKMKKYGLDQRYRWPYAIDKDSKLADAFGATKTPEIFLFDKNGKLVYKGAIDDSPSDEAAVKRHHLKMALDELADGKEITVKESRSVGCTIKRN